jgi:hypothetical protein
MEARVDEQTPYRIMCACEQNVLRKYQITGLDILGAEELTQFKIRYLIG